MVEKHSLFEFETFDETCKEQPHSKYYYYKIYTDDVDFNNWIGTNVFRESDDGFYTKQEARFAAIGHIESLESGEG